MARTETAHSPQLHPKETTMNFNTAHVIAARTETAYNAAQSFIANDCPVLEQRLKRAALTAAVITLEFTIACIDWLSGQVERAPEYRLHAQLAYVKSKQGVVRVAIKAARFDERYQVTATIATAWNRKGSITMAAFDRLFSLS